MNLYVVTVRHDHGKVRIRINAMDIPQAIRLVMAFEGCPLCAVIAVRKVRA